MSTLAATFRAGATPRHFVRLYRKEAKYEFLKLFRFRMFLLSTVAFPVMFYLLFGVANQHASAGGMNYARYLLASYSCFGMVGAALFGLGVGVASERAQGWLDVKQASPMPAAAYLVAKTLAAVAFALLTTTVLVFLARILAGVHLTASDILRLEGTIAACSLPFSALGLFLSLLVPVNAAPGVVNLIYLPMSLCSGLWMPIETLPHWLQKVAVYLPTYHAAQLALHIFGYDRGGSMAAHWAVLAAFTVAALLLGRYIFRRQELQS